MSGADKREQILTSALELFVERGYHGTPVPLIAEHARVGAGTIYRYFADKDALVNELFRTWKLRLGETLLTAVAPDQPWRRRFGALWQGLYRFSLDHPGAIEFLELHLHGGYLDDESRALEQQMGDALFGFIAVAQAEEAMVDLPPPAVVALVYGAFLGLLRASRLGWVTLDDALVAQAEERAWALIRR
ncbi:MAG TPA: TetR/AcrR family transcriptional regulator [Myxococcota bacterium]|nr:TetR/AcrR family transcriptional regulator [Myxococcota bacterium]